MTETITRSPWPFAEDTLAANPGRAYLWDLTRPVRPATAEEVAEYGRRHTDPAWRDLYRFANYTGHVDERVPAADPQPADLPRPGQDALGETGPRITGPGQPDRDCDDPGSAAVQHVLSVLNARAASRPDLPGGPTVSAPVDVRDVNAPGEPDQTVLMEPVKDDSTEGKPVHWTPEEPDQPACDADVDAAEDTVMLGILNPAKVTCPDCKKLIGGDPS